MTRSTPHGGGAAVWYVVYTKPQQEARAELHLRRRGIESFHPQLELPAYAGERRRCVPLFPNYLFAQVDLISQYHEVVWSPGVKRLVGAGGVPTPLDDAVVRLLKRHATADGRLRARPDLEAGQEVEILDGPFAGLFAIIQNPPDARGRVRVLMKLLNQRPVRAQVSVRSVRSGWVA
jgi:transcriptional antiterminator RfaH